MHCRHFLTTYGMLPGEISGLIDLAQHYHHINNNKSLLPLNLLRGKMIATLFFEPSTRTKSSFERAVKNLGGEVVELHIGASSVVKGESILDTARTLQSMGIDALVVRHVGAGVPHFLSKGLNIPVINAGDGAHEHPTQAMLDIMTIRQEFKQLNRINVLFLGDILHSRVARSNLYAMLTLGMRVQMAGPTTLLPREMGMLGAEIVSDLDRAIADADVVYVLRIQWERQHGGFFPSLAEYRSLYGIDEKRLPFLKDTAIIMHPGPVNVGVELSLSACNSPHTRIAEQVSHGVAVRMAVLHHLLAVG